MKIEILETMEDKTQLEVEVHARDTNSTERMFTVVSDYHLTHYKVRMYIIPS